MILIFFFKAYGDLRDLHSSPTRRYPYLFAAVGRPQNPRQLELIDNPGRPTVADAHAPLQQRRRADLVLDADLGRLAKQDRKSTRLNSSHVRISYSVFCLQKQKSPHHTEI